jgi:hypothetical protein
MWPDHIENFYASLSDRPTVDLASGDATSILSTVALMTNHEIKTEMHTSSKEITEAAKKFMPPDNLRLYLVDKYNITRENGREVLLYESDREFRTNRFDDVYFQENLSYHRADMLEFLRAVPDNSVNVMIGLFDLSISINAKSTIPEHCTSEITLYRTMLNYELARVIPKGAYLLAPSSFLDRARFESQTIPMEEFGFEEIKPQTPKDDDVFRLIQHDAGGPSTRSQKLYLKKHGDPLLNPIKKVDEAIQQINFQY